jgi:hypothetical protein
MLESADILLRTDEHLLLSQFVVSAVLLALQGLADESSVEN